jgi:hypothetical protein
MFQGSSRRFYFLGSYINSSDLGVGECFYFSGMAGGLTALNAGPERQVIGTPIGGFPMRHRSERLMRIDLRMSL